MSLRYRAHTLSLLAVLLVSSLTLSPAWADDVYSREDRSWAQEVDRSINLYRMSPSLYRSGLPESESLPLVERLNIGTVVNFTKEDDGAWLGNYPAARVSLPMHADRVDDADVLAALREIRAAEVQGPVLIHCKHGRDRTGLVAAMYRTVIEGWSKDEALQEMKWGGFGNPQYMDDAIAYVEDADVGALRQALADGSCSPSALDSCHVTQWLASLW